MELSKLKPAVITTIWGGKKLFSYGKESNEDHISETWELSFYKDHPCLLEDGTPLMDAVSKEDLGSKVNEFPIFPVLVKLIDSEKDLSIQVHPSDEFALENEHELGKTEMWHILEANEGSGIYLGFKEDTNAEEVRKAVVDGTILSLLNFIPVQKGESYFIKSGTVHAIGKGVTLIEIQQNSNITYRLYDYKRKDKDGKERELHLDKALKVLDYHKFNPTTFKKPVLGKSRYFLTTILPIDSKHLKASKDSFKSIHFIEGEGMINQYEYKKGDSFFLPSFKECDIKGNGEAIIVEVPTK